MAAKSHKKMYGDKETCSNTPIANIATIAPKRGYSVATVAKGQSRLFSNISFPYIRVS